MFLYSCTPAVVLVAAFRLIPSGVSEGMAARAESRSLEDGTAQSASAGSGGPFQ